MSAGWPKPHWRVFSRALIRKGRAVVWVNRYAGEHEKRESVRSTIGWVCFALLIGYVGFNVFLPNNDLNIGLDVIIWVLGLYVVIKYARRSLLTILRGTGESPDFLVVGITLSWLSQSGRAAGSIVTRLSGFDPAWLNSEFFGFVKMLTIFAAVCHVVPAGAVQLGDGESLPRQSRFGLAGAFVIALGLIVTLLVFKPDLKPWVDSMPGWTRDMFQTGMRAVSDKAHG